MNPMIDEFERSLPVEPEAEILPLSAMRDWRALAAEPLDFVFDEGHMLASTFALIAAPGGAGKSYLALQLGLSVALGREIIPGFSPTRQGPVLLCFGEDNEHVVSRRLDAICHTFDIGPGEIDRAIADERLQFICGRRARLLDFRIPSAPQLTPAHAELKKRCWANEYRLVVVDPVIKWAGLPNENDNAAQELAASALIELADETVTGVCIGVHHANKAAPRTGDTSQTASRGGSALPDASRWMAVLSEVGTDTVAKAGLNPEETELVRLTFGKNSYGPTRRGRPLFLERVEGGALRYIALEDIQADALLCAIIDELTDQPAGLTQWEIVKSDGRLAEEFRDRVKARVDPTTKTGRRSFNAAIDAGLATGGLIKRPHPDNENRKILEAAP